MKDDWNGLGKVRPWRELPLAKRIFYGVTHSPWNERSWEFARLAREQQIDDQKAAQKAWLVAGEKALDDLRKSIAQQSKGEQV